MAAGGLFRNHLSMLEIGSKSLMNLNTHNIYTEISFPTSCQKTWK